MTGLGNPEPELGEETPAGDNFTANWQVMVGTAQVSGGGKYKQMLKSEGTRAGKTAQPEKVVLAQA